MWANPSRSGPEQQLALAERKTAVNRLLGATAERPCRLVRLDLALNTGFAMRAGPKLGRVIVAPSGWRTEPGYLADKFGDCTSRGDNHPD